MRRGKNANSAVAELLRRPHFLVDDLRAQVLVLFVCSLADYAAVMTNSFYTLYKNNLGAEMVNASSSSSVNSVGQTATGRFTLHKRHLYYSFYTSTYPLPTRPKSVQFVDASGNIVEEQQVGARGANTAVRGGELMCVCVCVFCRRSIRRPACTRI